MRKVFDNIKVSPSINPAAAFTTATTGSAVDTLGYRDGSIVVAAGATDFASTDEVYTFTLTESDTSGGTYVAVSGISGTITVANTTLVVRVSELNIVRKRFLKVVMTPTGTTPSIICSAGLLLGQKDSNPVN